MPSWPAKDPDNVWDYPLNWAGQMTEDQNDTIAAYVPFLHADNDDDELEIMSAPSGGLGAAPSFTNTTTTVWLRGGTAGTTYQVVNRIRTAGGRQYDWTYTVEVRER